MAGVNVRSSNMNDTMAVHQFTSGQHQIEKLGAQVYLQPMHNQVMRMTRTGISNIVQYRTGEKFDTNYS